MEFLRRQRSLRVLIGLLTLSLGVVVVSPAARADGSQIDYADWLRMHISDASRPSIENAIERASSHGARTFGQFLDTFRTELDVILSADAERASTSADDRPDSDRPTEQRLQELRIEYNRIVGEAVLPQALAVASPVSPETLKRLAAPSATFLVPIQYRVLTRLEERAGNRVHAHSGTLLHTNAQPLGP
jgi:hypothetical protein